jgi:hypothetical protein
VPRSDKPEAPEPSFKRTYLSDEGGAHPKVEVDGPASPREVPIVEVSVPEATPAAEESRPKKPRLSELDIDELLDELDTLDILNDD